MCTKQNVLYCFCQGAMSLDFFLQAEKRTCRPIHYACYKTFMYVSFIVKGFGTFSKCPQIYIKLTWFEDNDSGKLPFKYY